MKFSPKKIILIVWLVFSIIYVGYSQYQYFVNFVGKNAYNRGVGDAVTQVINQAQKCEPFPINIGENKVELINAACLRPTENK